MDLPVPTRSYFYLQKRGTGREIQRQVRPDDSIWIGGQHAFLAIFALSGWILGSFNGSCLNRGVWLQAYR